MAAKNGRSMPCRRVGRSGPNPPAQPGQHWKSSTVASKGAKQRWYPGSPGSTPSSSSRHSPCRPDGEVGQSSSVRHASGKERSTQPRCPARSSRQATVPSGPLGPQSRSSRQLKQKFSVWGGWQLPERGTQSDSSEQRKSGGHSVSSAQGFAQKAPPPMPVQVIPASAQSTFVVQGEQSSRLTQAFRSKVRGPSTYVAPVAALSAGSTQGSSWPFVLPQSFRLVCTTPQPKPGAQSASVVQSTVVQKLSSPWSWQARGLHCSTGRPAGVGAKAPAPRVRAGGGLALPPGAPAGRARRAVWASRESCARFLVLAGGPGLLDLGGRDTREDHVAVVQPRLGVGLDRVAALGERVPLELREAVAVRRALEHAAVVHARVVRDARARLTLALADRLSLDLHEDATLLFAGLARAPGDESCGADAQGEGSEREAEERCHGRPVS